MDAIKKKVSIIRGYSGNMISYETFQMTSLASETSIANAKAKKFEDEARDARYMLKYFE